MKSIKDKKSLLRFVEKLVFYPFAFILLLLLCTPMKAQKNEQYSKQGTVVQGFVADKGEPIPGSESLNKK